jgi:protein TonB
MQLSKSVVLMALFSFIMSWSFGQQTAIDSTIYAAEALDIKPIYEGGEKAMFQFLAQNIKMPLAIRQRIGTTGTVHVSFVVDEKGYLDTSSVKMLLFMTGANDKDKPKRITSEAKLDYIQAECVMEAKRVVRLLKKWTPAQADGKAVKCRRSVPITFKNEGVIIRR